MSFNRKLTFAFLTTLILVTACGGKKNKAKEKVQEDGVKALTPEKLNSKNHEMPFKVQEHTLPNGLKIYFTKNTIKPDFYAEIIVKAGAKHEDDDATGLAHYLEHMLFKGTSQLGTKNWEEEKKINKQIIAAFEEKRAASTDEEKQAIAKKIDQLSLQAAEHIVPGEYDNLLSFFGQTFMNAHTFYDETVYKERLPKNRFEHWVRLQRERFSIPALARTFQWELEIVYEEKNRRSDHPMVGVWGALSDTLFAGHNYSRDVIGKTDHLKNPSLKKTIEFFEKYYVPNNVAFAISGDLDFEQVKSVLTKHFSDWKAKDVPRYQNKKLPVLKERIEKTVQFKAEPRLDMNFRLPPIQELPKGEAEALGLLKVILKNGTAGLFDILENNQKLKAASAYYDTRLVDYNVFGFSAELKPGQSHQQVEKVLLSAIKEVQSSIDEELLKAAQLNYKKKILLEAEDHNSRIELVRSAVLHELDWSYYANHLKRIMQVKKEDVIKVAKKYFSGGYAVVFREKGESNKDGLKKPELTPLAGKTAEGNSDYFVQMAKLKAQPIPPQFFDPSLVQSKELSDREVYRVENQLTEIANLEIEFSYGKSVDLEACLMLNMLESVGTKGMTAVDINKKLYSLGTSFKVSCSEYGEQDASYLKFDGLEEQIPQALELIVKVLRAPEIEKAKFEELKKKIIAEREQLLISPDDLSSAAIQSVFRPKDSAYKNVISTQKLQQLQIADMQKVFANFLHSKKTVKYVGRKSLEDVDLAIQKILPVNSGVSNEAPPHSMIDIAEVSKPTLLLYPLENQRQAKVYTVLPGPSIDNSDVDSAAKELLFKEFFGGGMGSVVFQEIREKRALAYTAWAQLKFEGRKGDQKFLISFLGTQNDKFVSAVRTMEDIIRNTPWSEQKFKNSQSAVVSKVNNKQFSVRKLIPTLLAQKRNQTPMDGRKKLLKLLPSIDMQDVSGHIQKTFTEKSPTLIVIGDQSKLDLKALEKDYEIKVLQQSDILGF